MNVQIQNKKLLNLLKLLDINVWVAENKEFDDPIMFSVRYDNYDRFIVFLIEKYITFTIFPTFSLPHEDLLVIDIKDNQLIIEDDLPKAVNQIIVICLDRENHIKLLSEIDQ